MRRLKDYCRLLAWQTGVSYLLLWAVTVWALDEGATVFGKSGVCYPDEAKVLFYWVCEAASPYSILASVVNFALTATVWAPVYVAAATGADTTGGADTAGAAAASIDPPTVDAASNDSCGDA